MSELGSALPQLVFILCCHPSLWLFQYHIYDNERVISWKISITRPFITQCHLLQVFPKKINYTPEKTQLCCLLHHNYPGCFIVLQLVHIFSHKLSWSATFGDTIWAKERERVREGERERETDILSTIEISAKNISLNFSQ